MIVVAVEAKTLAAKQVEVALAQSKLDQLQSAADKKKVAKTAKMEAAENSMTAFRKPNFDEIKNSARIV
jgi:hypothetical protein